MNSKVRSVVVLVVQAVLVSSIAGKYLYERATCPKVWVRTAQVDPDSPMRGRYLSLQLVVDACGLDKKSVYFKNERYHDSLTGVTLPMSWQWLAKLGARDGKLIPIAMARESTTDELEYVEFNEKQSCQNAHVTTPTEFFLPENANVPVPKGNDELWVEVTVPPSGPPRPIQLALKKAGVWTPLRYN